MTTQDMIDVLEHYKNGGEVEHNNGSGWEITSDPCFDFRGSKYRPYVKQKTAIEKIEEEIEIYAHANKSEWTEGKLSGLRAALEFLRFEKEGK